MPGVGNVKVLEIQGSRGRSAIFVGESIGNLGRYIPGGKTVIITDTHVRKHHGKNFPPCEVIEIDPGEGMKSLDTTRGIYERLLDLEADRSTFVVGIGGGVICDIAGFVASTFLRGLKFGFVPSTLLSMVDASVGGKNGVNLGGYKNMIGVINQPEFVLCDMDLLKTLHEREVRCGLAEVVKHASIADAEMFLYLEKHNEEALKLDTKVIGKLVYDSMVIKSSIVNRDEREKGERRKLNFGHTFGHGIEKIYGFPHGEAVSMGMVLASALSVRMGLLSEKEAERIEGLLRKFRLPTRIALDRKRVLDALGKDKKRTADCIHFILLHGIGCAAVEEIRMTEWEEFLGGEGDILLLPGSWSEKWT